MTRPQWNIAHLSENQCFATLRPPQTRIRECPEKGRNQHARVTIALRVKRYPLDDDTIVCHTTFCQLVKVQAIKIGHTGQYGWWWLQCYDIKTLPGVTYEVITSVIIYQGHVRVKMDFFIDICEKTT